MITQEEGTSLWFECLFLLRCFGGNSWPWCVWHLMPHALQSLVPAPEGNFLASVMRAQVDNFQGQSFFFFLFFFFDHPAVYGAPQPGHGSDQSCNCYLRLLCGNGSLTHCAVRESNLHPRAPKMPPIPLHHSRNSSKAILLASPKSVSQWVLATPQQVAS